jgi:predicted dehydrogenase
MDNDTFPSITRRTFAASAAAFMIVPRHVLGGPGQVAPSDRVNLGVIGLGRQGMAVMMEILPRPDVQVLAVCDCNRESKNYVEYSPNDLLRMARKLLGKGYENWGEDLTSPGMAQLTHHFRTSLSMGGRDPAKRVVEAYYGSKNTSGSYKGCTAYRDYRELLEKESGVDAVYIATPDHWHAPISMAAMNKRKHVLCQKPMTHSIAEAHRVAQMAREMKLTASLPVNNPSTESTRLITSWIEDGAIGKVREIHNWTDRPYWPQGVVRPAESSAIPDGLDWDMWLGPARERPYNNAYLPFVWRGWVDFGCGSFGDMGCYSFAGIWKVLGLGAPKSVECSSSEPFEETYPKASMVYLDFPDRDIRLTWYDGGLKPRRPAGLRAEDQRYFAESADAIMYVGDKGMLLAGFNGDSPRVYPESPKYQPPPRKPRDNSEPRRDEAIDQFIASIKGGPAPLADFEKQATPTEAFLLGCLAQQLPGERFEWDAANQRITNSEKANKLIDPAYRGTYL